MTDENEKLKAEICKRMQALDDEMNTVLGMVNSFAFPSKGNRRQPICGITLLKKAVSTKAKIAEFTRECKKPTF
jgi:hypothetical protein